MFSIKDVLHQGCSPSVIFSIRDVFHQGCSPSGMFSIRDVLHQGFLQKFLLLQNAFFPCARFVNLLRPVVVSNGHCKLMNLRHMMVVSKREFLSC